MAWISLVTSTFMIFERLNRWTYRESERPPVVGKAVDLDPSPQQTVAAS